MPARKYRTGADLEQWKARKGRHKERMDLARERAKSLSDQTLVLLPEAAGMMGGISVKSLREAEARARERGKYWPLRIYLTSRLTGYRLSELDAFIKSREGSDPTDDADAPTPETADA